MSSPTSALKAIRNQITGFRQNLAFSNGWSILAQRLFRRHCPLVSYHWKKRWWLVCDLRYQDAHAPKELLADGCYDRWILRSIRDGCLSYVNVGANIGAFDIAVAGLAKQIPHACSIELNPGTFARLSFNVHLNNLRYVRMLNCGVGGEPGTFVVHSSNCSLADGLFAPPLAGAEDLQAFKVPILTLADSLEKVGLGETQFDLLKLDCEGAEYGIIRQSSPELLRRFRNVVIELHPEPPNESAAALYEKLTGCGFETDQPQWLPSEPPGLRFWERR